MTYNFRFASHLAGALFACASAAAPALTQDTPRRLELADSALSALRADTAAPVREPVRELARENRTGPRQTPPLSGVPRPAEVPARNSFVRDQAVLGALVYGPSFARAVARAGVPTIAAYVVMGGGAYLMASGLSHDLAITETTSRFATGSALHGALAGWALAQAAHADEHGTAGGIFLGSVAGTASALALGGGLTDGEAAASNFGTEFLGIASYGLASAGGDTRTSGLVAVGAALAGAPLGYWYAHSARYSVTPGDVTALWTSAAIGAAAAGVGVVNGSPTRATVAATLTGGALLGVLAGDRLLVRRFDHTSGEGRLVMLGAATGGVAGAGLAMLTGAASDRRSVATVAFSAAGALGGLAFAEYYLAPLNDEARRLGRVQLDAVGLAAALAGRPGAYPLLRVTF